MILPIVCSLRILVTKDCCKIQMKINNRGNQKELMKKLMGLKYIIINIPSGLSKNIQTRRWLTTPKQCLDDL